MKRVSVALAALTAVLLVGTASAQVPDGSGSAMSRLRQLGLRPLALQAAQDDGAPAGPVVAGTRGVRDVVGAGEGLVDAESVVDPETLEPVTGTLEGTPLIQDLIAELPPQVADILNALPFAGPDPVEAPAPAPHLVPELGPPAPAPAPAAESAKPAPAPERVRTPGQLRAAAGDRNEVFPGLPGAGHAGYTTGSALHLDALTVEPQVTNLDVAFSGATFTSAPINETLVNEMARTVAPQLGANSGFGRGSGLELGLGTPEGADGQVILTQRAEAKSPPTTEVGPFETTADLDPVATASLLRSRARSLANAACTTGVDLSFGEGYAADTGLVGEGPDNDLVQSTAPDPERAVNQSGSATRLVPQAGTPLGPIAKFGLQSETRQTLAPVTLLEGTPQQFTIELAGEWVLRATADGKGVGELHYGPGEVSPQTPLLRILDDAGAPMNELDFQDIFGGEGLVIPIPGVAEIAIGEAPRAIGGAAGSQVTESSTYVAGAVDVVRVTLLDGSGLDLRIGHMEAAVAVPEGGIECGIGLVKESSHEVVRPGQSFTWTLTLTNPNDCILTQVKMVDTISTPGTTGIKYTVDDTAPKADSQTGTTELIWNDIGPIEPGGSKNLSIDVTVAPDSGGGKFLNEAVATGVCGPAEAEAEGAVGVPLEARVSLNLPEVQPVAESPLRGELPRTGGLLAALPALALIGGGLALRRLKGR